MVEMFSVIVDLKNNVQSWHILCCLNTYNVKIEMALYKIVRKNLMSLMVKGEVFMKELCYIYVWIWSR